MPLSERTKLEMRAGAQALAIHQGHGPLTDEEWERLSLTSERSKKFWEWERQGVIKLELRHTPTGWVRIVHVGDHQFKETDPWPYTRASI